MSQEGVSIQVTEGLVKPIVEAQIRAAIAAEMSKDPYRLIDAMVTEALQYKVDKSGERSRYPSDNQYTWLSIKIEQLIRDEARRALAETIEEHRDKIKDAIKKLLSKQVGANAIAAAVINGISKNLECKYSNQIHITFLENKD